MSKNALNIDPLEQRRWEIVHIKKAFDPKKINEICKQLDLLEKKTNTAQLTEREARALDRGEAADELRKETLWFQIWKTASEKLKLELGTFRWISFPPQVRHIRKESHSVPWHQDSGYQKALGTRGHSRTMTCFVPLDPDAEKRTTLQFSGECRGELAHRELNGFGAGLSESFDQLKHFRLEQGDCLLFGDYVIHRTFTPPGALTERRSIEFRFTQSEDSISQKDYFDVDDLCWVQQNGTKKEHL